MAGSLSDSIFDLLRPLLDQIAVQGYSQRRAARAAHKRRSRLPYSAISAGASPGPASGRSSITIMQSAAPASSTAAAPNT